MIINSSKVVMTAEAASLYETTETTKVLTANNNTGKESSVLQTKKAQSADPVDTLSLSDKAKELMSGGWQDFEKTASLEQLQNAGNAKIKSLNDALSAEDPKSMMIKMLVNALNKTLNPGSKTGSFDDDFRKSFQSFIDSFSGGGIGAQAAAPAASGVSDLSAAAQKYAQAGGSAQASPTPKALIQATATREVSFEQSFSFSASAQVQTSDGKSINVQLDLNMSSSFYSKESATVTQVFTDPLVFNLNASSAELSNTKFSFDLDADGTADQITNLAKSSGFLALDRNGDGKINDGSELFGAKTGDGFKELSVYDDDGNGWIDEGDSIFNKLRIWQNNDDGTQSLIGLGQAGIGAIFLGNVAGNYNLNADPNNPQARIASTGMFLREDGTAGTVQHVDFSI
ncbi:MAG: hypothetical protein LBM98_02350 [Oscillospiraceae bacterium]|jgi:hypothetical protein|nr:hypothetical protein [Oscillospiraceae bacterium]